MRISTRSNSIKIPIQNTSYIKYNHYYITYSVYEYFIPGIPYNYMENTEKPVLIRSIQLQQDTYSLILSRIEYKYE